jgi:Polyphosphate kinase 2 (PPK2)
MCCPVQKVLCAAGRALRRAGGRPAEALEAVADRPPGAREYAAYTEARRAMPEATHTKYAPWTLVDFNDQRRGRLKLIRHLLDSLPETDVPDTPIEFPPLPVAP